MMLQTESTIFAEADARVFHMLMSANRTERRLMAADRTIASAYRRVATLRRLQQAKASRAHANAERELAKEFGRSRISAAWGRTFIVQMPQSKRTVSARLNSSHARTSKSRRTLRAYSTPLIDKRGRVALYMNIKYRGFKSKGWRAGLAADHIEYIMRELALEMADTQHENPISNMGKSADEIMAGWRALEVVEEGYRANAIVQYRIVWNLPHNLDGGQRRALVEEFCERTFGRLGLPYAAAIHTPDAAGDKRNNHAHICFSTRPVERVGLFEWAISEEKVNGLTDAAGLKLMRALGAAHMNRACRAAGLSDLFTHQTYADRGIDAQRQERVGAAAMAAHERGEVVNVIARNAAIVEQNEASVARQRVEQRLDANLHLQRLLILAQKQTSRRKITRLQLATAQTLSKMASRAALAFRNSRLIKRQQPSIAEVIRLQAQATKIGHHSARPFRHRSLRASALVVQKLAADIVHRSTAIKRGDNVIAIARLMRQLATRVSNVRVRLTAISKPPNRIGHPIIGKVAELAAASTIASTKVQSLTTASASTQRLRNDWMVIRDRLDAYRAAELAERQRAVRDAIMAAEGLNCTIAEGQIRYRLRALNEDDRNAFLSLDQSVQRALLLERHAADQRAKKEGDDRQAAAEATHAAALERTAQQAAQVAQACRIIMQAPAKPYRGDSQLIYPDWNHLSPAERAVVKAVGISNPDLKAALVRRVEADAKVDADALAMQLAAKSRVALPKEQPTHSLLPQVAVSDEGDLDTTNTSTAKPPHSDLQINGKVNMLVIQDVWIGPANDDGFTVSEQALMKVGLTKAELALPEVQFALDAIHNDQIDRLEPVLDDFEPTPQFRVRKGVVALDDRFSPALQVDVDRWAADPRFQAFVASTWLNLKLDDPSALAPANAGNDRETEATIQTRDTPIDLWSQAASVRRDAMDGWQAEERGDRIEGARPGRILARPGQSELPDDEEPGADRPVPRFHPGLIPGGSIGG